VSETSADAVDASVIVVLTVGASEFVVAVVAVDRVGMLDAAVVETATVVDATVDALVVDATADALVVDAIAVVVVVVVVAAVDAAVVVAGATVVVAVVVVVFGGAPTQPDRDTQRHSAGQSEKQLSSGEAFWSMHDVTLRRLGVRSVGAGPVKRLLYSLMDLRLLSDASDSTVPVSRLLYA
jgi:hypothetical protein